MRIWSVLLFSFFAMGTIAESQVIPVTGNLVQETKYDERESDIICGPRCVQYVLAHFGIDSDVIDLAKEIQWPDLESGASLKKLADAMEARGLHTCALRINASQNIKWQFPVIFHTNPENSRIGHFQVWLPGSNDSGVQIWDGREGLISIPQDEWMRLRSGAILLLSPETISNPETAITESSRLQMFAGVALVLGGAAALLNVVSKTRSSIK